MHNLYYDYFPLTCFDMFTKIDIVMYYCYCYVFIAKVDIVITSFNITIDVTMACFFAYLSTRLVEVWCLGEVYKLVSKYQNRYKSMFLLETPQKGFMHCINTCTHMWSFLLLITAIFWPVLICLIWILHFLQYLAILALFSFFMPRALYSLFLMWGYLTLWTFSFKMRNFFQKIWGIFFKRWWTFFIRWWTFFKRWWTFSNVGELYQKLIVSIKLIKIDVSDMHFPLFKTFSLYLINLNSYITSWEFFKEFLKKFPTFEFD